MVFSSMLFLWLFLPIVLITYFISNKKVKNIILLIASLVFYAWGEPKYIILMLISIVVNYIFGLLIDKYRKKSKLFLILDILFNLLLLGYFKYYNFFVNNINNIFNHQLLSIRNIALPIGISFYTFQILSYIIDLYRNEIKVQKNILNLALYISFFPQLIAGPIVRYKNIEEEINNRTESVENFADGVRRFTYGLGKKVIFSNTLAYVVDTIYSNNVNALNTPVAWLAAIAYTLQIYYDFSGYSDMAIGLGRMFGFHFPENFDYPYISQSITEFWRRWHISLSSWFKEYLYIPLGGNRKGKLRTYINLFIVFFATGLWHGASWNFIVWGGFFYGSILVIEKLFLKKLLDNNKLKVINHIYVMLIVIVGWVLFRADGLKHGLSIIKLLFSFDFKNVYVLLPTFINMKVIIVIILSILLCGPAHVLFNKIDKEEKIKKVYSTYIEVFIIALILFISIAELISSTYNPFIYFRF